jgi:hypothetical protein
MPFAPAVRDAPLQANPESPYLPHLTTGIHIRMLVRMYEANGTIKVIFPEQSFPSGFTKREFVVTTAAERYPQDLKFELVKDKCALLNSFSEGQDVTVNFDIRGNEYNGKYFVNLSAWKIQAGGGQAGSAQPASASAKSTSSEPSPADLRNNDDFDDDDIAPF